MHHTPQGHVLSTFLKPDLRYNNWKKTNVNEYTWFDDTLIFQHKNIIFFYVFKLFYNVKFNKTLSHVLRKIYALEFDVDNYFQNFNFPIKYVFLHLFS